MSDLLAMCARCGIKKEQQICRVEGGKGPAVCPTRDAGEVLAAGVACYEDEEVKAFARQASIQEASCYIERDAEPFVLHPTKPRLQEIIEFARRMGYRRLGLAFCSGFHPEARILGQILEEAGFEVVSVVCKLGNVPKETIGITEEEKVHIGHPEAMCNPITQAGLLNAAGTEFNIVMGLCVGHDSLFFKHAEAPTTVFAVKDRVLGHNPLAAIYTSGTYYQRLRAAQ